jgi:malate dehydrogenase (oxaloacetate-decarboxylating)
MKSFSFKIDPITGEDFYEVYVTGQRLLNNPCLNKGHAFPRDERHELELGGLLAHGVSSLDAQANVCLEHYRRKSDDLERYIYLMELQNRNETLFYQVILRNLEEMIPIIYTPTVGQACMQMSHILRRARGIYIHPDNIDSINQIFEDVTLPDLRLIVVTDGERILGLGDLGSDGMGISIGKVGLYVAAGCLHPACCMPMCIDVGTNNERLLNDPAYMGYRKTRLVGAAYDDFIEKFVNAVKRAFPHALLQWEDFAKHHAFDLLDRYRDRILSFNDDIQGTGATALAALVTAARIRETRMREMKYVMAGFGEAGRGISDNIRTVMEEEGLTDAEARGRIFAVDRQGLLLADDPALEPQQKAFAHSRSDVAGWKLANPDRIDLADVIRNVHPDVLVGVTAQRGLFSEEILREMAAQCPRPIILALSNPTSKVECTPDEVMKATNGRFLMATGSPFAPIETPDGVQGIAQCNNLFIFPGVGLGAIISGAPKVTDRMFTAASKALAQMVTPEARRAGWMLPQMKDIRESSAQAALAVAKEARDSGIGRRLDDEALERLIRKAQWQPHYVPYRLDRCSGRH